MTVVASPCPSRHAGTFSRSCTGQVQNLLPDQASSATARHLSSSFMDCYVDPLRKLFSSPQGDGVGQCIVDTVAGGEPVNFHFSDGTTLTVTDVWETRRVLRTRFDWVSADDSEENVLDDRIVAHVLGMCQRVETHFSMKEIVARVMDERPEMILQFAAAWGTLIRRKLIRVCGRNEPALYEVVEAAEA